MTSQWGWKPERTYGIWRYGAAWLRPFVAAVPWLTVALAFGLLYLVGGALTASEGVLFDLPEGTDTNALKTELVAVVMPLAHETVVIFDDSRYVLNDSASCRSLEEHLRTRTRSLENKSLLVLADRRVVGGELMRFAALARASGLSRVLFAAKRAVRER